MKSSNNLVLVPGVAGTVFLGAFALAAWAYDGTGDGRHHARPAVVDISDARLKFEINDTDKDGGIQVFIDADPWRRMTIYDPSGRKLFRAVTKGSIGKQGGTELFLESGEPTFDEVSLEELLGRFPEGEYRFRGRGNQGEKLVGTALLTHNIPDGPELVSPLEGDGPVDPDNTVMRWLPVGPANGSPIIAYQVLVVQPETDFAAIPKITLDIMMPASATSMTVPPGFLQRDTEYEWEVLALEASGNQTLSSWFFRTAP